MSILKRWEFWFIVILSVVAIALIVYGVTTHEEPGFKNPDARWGKDFPLTVEVQAYSIRPDDNIRATRVAKDAIDSMNEFVDFEVFKYVDDGEDRPAIHITIGVPVDAPDSEAIEDGPSLKEAGGFYELHGKKGLWWFCVIETGNTGSDEILYYTLQHELGHCLDLDHDDYERSIMYPVQRSHSIASMPWLSDWDKKLIRERYAP